MSVWTDILQAGIPVRVEHQVLGGEQLAAQINQLKWVAIGSLVVGVSLWIYLRTRRG